MKQALARLCVLFAVAALSVAAFAFYDAQILIQRALNSPTLNVKYSGANAALVELRLNGISLGSKTVSPTKSSGETSFTLELSTLNDGENEVEVRIFDKNGKLLGSETTIIATDDGTPSPVRLSNPKMGATVQGPVDIRVGFGREMRNAYVSFFVNSQFKSMTNSAPFSYVWDTTREPNGWHELEAWVVDTNSTTFKTRKIRVLVNNPGGRTERRPAVSPTVVPKAVPNPVQSVPGVKNVPKTTNVATAASNAITSVAAPASPPALASNAVKAQPGERIGVREPALGSTQSTGSRLMTPNAKAASPAIKLNVPTGTALVNLPSSLGTFRITRGQKVPNIGNYSIAINGQAVNFDVSPRVQNGVPLAPFRHLLESAGGEVKWAAGEKRVEAHSDGKTIKLRIGDRNAYVNGGLIELEIVPFLENGRTIVPLSFLGEALEVEIEFDANTGHVLITSVKKQ